MVPTQPAKRLECVWRYGNLFAFIRGPFPSFGVQG